MFRLLVFATELEAKATLITLRANRLDGPLWRFDGGEILITGMGILHCSQALLRQLGPSPSYGEIWQLGFSAALREQPIGSIHEIARAIRPPPWRLVDSTSRQLHQSCFPGLELRASGEITLATVDAPLFNSARRAQLAQSADLLDMEGYAFAAIAQALKLPARAIKIASDRGVSGGRTGLLARAQGLSESLALWVVDALSPKGDSN